MSERSVKYLVPMSTVNERARRAPGLLNKDALNRSDDELDLSSISDVKDSQAAGLWRKLRLLVFAVSAFKRAKLYKLYPKDRLNRDQVTLQRSVSKVFHSFQVETVPEDIPRLILRPNNPIRSAWNVVLAILLVYTATLMPFSMAFIDTVKWNAWFILELTIDGLFFTDVLINLNSAYFNSRRQLVVSRKKIFITYAKSWLVVDILASFPTGLIEDGENDPNSSGDYNNLL